MTTAVVAGLGSAYREDDAAGMAVAGAVRALAGDDTADLVVAEIADPLDLLGIWDGADLAVVVDATRSGRPPGTLLVMRDAHLRSFRAGGGWASTHGLGLGDVVRLARAAGAAPAAMALVGIEGARFGQGEGLSPAVAAAVPLAARNALRLARLAAATTLPES